jgi:hypothetical protein
VKLLSIILFTLPFQSTFSQEDFKRAKSKVRYTEDEIQKFKQADTQQGCEGTSAVFSLYDEGGSLNGVYQQDQDGLNTCYANTCSLILKSLNPTLPVPSYLDLASKNPSIMEYHDGEKKKQHPFDVGGACILLNSLKKNSENSLCTGNLLENQGIGVQDKILYKLYDVMNIYGYTPQQMSKVLGFYEGYLNKNPYPGKNICGIDQPLDFTEYIGSKVVSLSNSYMYVDGGGEDTPESEQCAELMGSRLKSMGMMQTIVYDWGEANVPVHSSFEDLSQKYLNSLNNSRFPSGKTYKQFIIELLNAESTSHSVYESVLGNHTQAKNYQKQLDVIATHTDKEALKDVAAMITGNDLELKKCWTLAQKNWSHSNSGILFNTQIDGCYKGVQEWRNEIWEVTKSCHDPEKDLLDIFKTLTALDRSVNNIKKFLVNKDKNILAEIINNHCPQKVSYNLPSLDCKYEEIPPGIVSTASVEDWPHYQDLVKDFEAYLKESKITDEQIDMTKFAAFWYKDRAGYLPQSEEDKAIGKKAQLDPHSDSTRQYLSDIYAKFGSQTTLSRTEILDHAKTVFAGYQERNKNINHRIVSSLKSGVAVGISACGSMFSDSEKQNYKNCLNHSVAATGMKCQNGRLKLQLTNSWGIGCNDSEKTSHMFECEKDRDGLPNGRAWVDYKYIADQGMGLQAY